MGMDLSDINCPRKQHLYYCLYQHLEKGISIPTSSSPYEMVEFYDNSKKSISLMCTILSYDNDDTMDGTILGFL